MNSKALQAANCRGSDIIGAAATPDGINPNTYYDNKNKSAATSCCCTPYVSAPSSPGRGGYFYSAPSSPMHHLLKSSATSSSSGLIGAAAASSDDRSSFEFDFGFSGTVDDADDDDRSSTMSSADELFFNGQIRPMKLSCHLQRPQNLAPLIDVEEDEDEEGAETEAAVVREGRDLKKLRDRSLRRKARSLSPLRTDWNDDLLVEEERRNKRSEGSKIENPSTSSSRSSSGGTSSKRWVFLKDFIRSKSDGSNSSTTGSRHAARLWSSISFSHRKTVHIKPEKLQKAKEEFSQTVGGSRLKNGIVTRRSAHEAHYTAKRAQAEEMRRKTFLPYRQGLLGCLGFSSKSYGAMDGFTRALDSISSR